MYLNEYVSKNYVYVCVGLARVLINYLSEYLIYTYIDC